MKKERITMSDNKRYLIFYTFDDVESIENVDEKSKVDNVKTEINDNSLQVEN